MTIFFGINQALTHSSGAPYLQEDIEADIEGEQETLPELTAADLEDDDESNHLHPLAAFPGLSETIAGASKGVTDATESDYRRLANACVSFLISLKLISHRDEFISSTPLLNTPTLIIAWIMNECDSIALDGSGPSKGPQSSYTHAQKMRASMTYAFGRTCKLGNACWQVSGSSSTGNPSVSTEVASYMVSLRRRKVQGGETATSARAITSKDLAALYDYNHQDEHFVVDGYDPKADSSWGGPVARRAVQAIYLLSFLCLLRIDEALKIQYNHIEFIDENGGNLRMVLTLPFRKTHQFGEIKPFVLWAMPPADAHLCPVHALAEWIKESGITSGFVFRRIVSHDRVSQKNVAMTSQQFLEMFRNNLIDVGIDPAPYGTHSFRRGGCQYYSSERRWELRDICDWGGWSLDFTNLTIVKYLMSWNDRPTRPREDFLNPNRAPATKCFRCGRSCHCA